MPQLTDEQRHELNRPRYGYYDSDGQRKLNAEMFAQRQRTRQAAQSRRTNWAAVVVVIAVVTGVLALLLVTGGTP